MRGTNAIAMLVRRAWRQYWRASIFLAVVAGLAASVIGASFQAAARSDTSLARFTRQSRTYDVIVQGCPPTVNVQSLQGSADLIERCENPEVAARFRRVLARVKGVERTGVASTAAIALWTRRCRTIGVGSRSQAVCGRPTRRVLR